MTELRCFHGKTYCPSCKVGIRSKSKKTKDLYVEREKSARKAPRKCAACSRKLRRGQGDVCPTCVKAGHSIEPLYTPNK